MKASPLPNILQQDVQLLTEHPVWLCGTPMLADTKLGLLYKGSDVIMIINHMTRALSSPSNYQQQQQQPLINNNSTMASLFQLPDEDGIV
jgi:hypothetical protein